MSEVTQILGRVQDDDPKAANELLGLLYDELRLLAAQKMAREQAGHTLQATALVHEAWLRLAQDKDHDWKSRGHFFGAAAEAMRRILIESARRRSRLRHGGGLERVSADAIEMAVDLPQDRLLQISEVLDELEKEAPESAKVVKLRYFAGLTQEQVAEVMGISLRTAERHWTWAKAWLFRAIRSRG